MTRYGNVGAAVRGEDAVKDPFGPDGLVCAGFAVESYPELVVWSEAGFDPVAWEKIVDVGLVAASIARMSAYTFAEILLD